MALRTAAPPHDGLYRIGRRPDPLQLPPREAVRAAANRFDDPLAEFRVLYAAEQRVACFVETLAAFRLDPALIAALADLPHGDVAEELPTYGVIPHDWHAARSMGHFRVPQSGPWLDLRNHETLATLRGELASTLAALGHSDLDLAAAVSMDRRLTQQIARFCYERGYLGLVYTSRLGADLTCWAVFDTAQITPLAITPITARDPDLVATLARLGLRSAR